MKNWKPEPAFIGYAWDKVAGFLIVICPKCDGAKREMACATPLPYRLSLCSLHVYKLNCARLGENAA